MLGILPTDTIHVVTLHVLFSMQWRFNVIIMLYPGVSSHLILVLRQHLTSNNFVFLFDWLSHPGWKMLCIFYSMISYFPLCFAGLIPSPFILPRLSASWNGPSMKPIWICSEAAHNCNQVDLGISMNSMKHLIIQLQDLIPFFS